MNNFDSDSEETLVPVNLNASFETPTVFKNIPKVTPKSTKQLNNSPILKNKFGFKPTVPLHEGVTEVYKVIQKTTGTLGGNGSNGAIYGELTIGSMQKIVNILVEKCELGCNSRFIDVGSGLGKPNFHVAQYPGTKLSIGVELEEIRWQVLIFSFF
jgi:hypothetical protein